MKIHFLPVILILLSNFAFSSLATADQSERTPFTDVLFDSAPSVKVEVNGDIYYLLAINGIKRADLIADCEQKFGAACACAFTERFSDTMAKLQHPVGDKVELRLYRLDNHQVLTLADQAVSNENQIQLMINRELRNETCAQ